MLLQKKGFPEESELVLCTITNVQGHSVFARIEDYGTSGMIHISEVAPGRRRKIADIKQQQKAKKIVEYAAKKLDIEPDNAYKEVSDKLLKEYDSVFIGFMDVVENDASLEKLGVSKALAIEVEKVVRQRLKPETVEVRGTLMLSSTAPDGVEKVRAALKEAKIENIEMKYLGAGRFLLG